jgi:EpsI family protein
MWVYNRKVLTVFFLFNFLFILAVNSTVLVDLLDEWWSTGSYNHGLLGLALALYVIWTKREVFASPQGNILALLLLSATSLLLLLASLASIGQLQMLSLFLVIITLLLSFYGFQSINKLLLPLVMILLVLPIWNVLQIPLREISTWVSFHSVDLLGFEIIRQGYKLITPGGTFIVEEACSGLSFFLASALYAVFVAQINHLSRQATLVFFAFAVAVAIVANWIRITVIVIVGSQTAMQHFIVQDHLTFGWMVFAACFVSVIIIGNIYFGEQSPDNNELPKAIRKTPQIRVRYLFAVSAITLFFALMTVLLPSRFDSKYKFILPTIPLYTQLTQNNASSPNWHPVSHGASSEEFNYFLQGKELLQVYLANYIRQRQGEEMIFIENHLFDENRWFDVRQQTIQLNSPFLEQINLIMLRRDGHRSRLIAYWYLVDGQFSADKKTTKWHEIQAAIKGQPGATLIAIAFDYKNENETFALKTIAEFATAFTLQPININRAI